MKKVIRSISIIKAKLPVAEMFGFNSSLKSSTGGQGFFWLIDVKYEPLPKELEQKVVTQIRSRKGITADEEEETAPVIDVDLPAGLEGLSLDTLKQAITVVTENNDIKRLTIDSISALKLGMDEKQFRHELIRFFDYISSLGITSLIVAEIPSSAIEERFSVEHFLSQGVVFLRLIRVKDEKIRAVEIHKLRAVKHDLTLRPLTMDDTGVTIYPEERVFVSGLND